MLRPRWIPLLTVWVVALGACGEEDNSLGIGPPPPPTPSISISPASAVAGGSDVTLTITGANFAGAAHNRSYAVWSVNGASTVLATTFVTSSQLTAVIPTALLSQPVTAEVFVETGDVMDDVPLQKTLAASFEVTQPNPLISISPTDAVAGRADLVLNITGATASFAGAPHNRSWAVWSMNGNNTVLATTFVSSTQLTAVIPATLMTTPVAAQVFVSTGDPMGDFLLQSNSIGFRVSEATASTTTPAIGLSPMSWSFTYYVRKQQAPPSQTLHLTDQGGGTLTWTGTSSRSWLKISPKTGTAPSTVTVSVDPAATAIGINGYRPSSLQASITVSAAGASNTPQTIPVILNVRYY
jgi:hypothetical protein